MTAPVVIRHGWQVHTNDALYRGGEGSASGAAVWFWSAWGPRGHESGGENSADAAMGKAYAAAMLLSDPRESAK